MQQPDPTATRADSDDATAIGHVDPVEFAIGCPLHFAMARLAELAVRQHVLYEQGEFTARPEVLRDLGRWTQIHALIAAHTCPASHSTRAVHDAAPDLCLLEDPLRGLPEPTGAQLRAMLVRCAAHNGEDGCPLAAEPGGRLLGGAIRPAGR